MTAPTTAMVLAAGLGTRMRPLTDDRPKALVEVGGKALIDHVLDRLADAGVTDAVVNVHWFADRLESHLAARTRPMIRLSDERAELLETGGGLKKARPLLGDGPVFVANIDSVWIDRGDALGDLIRLWNPARMDAALHVFEIEGEGVDSVIARATTLNPQSASPSAAMLFASVNAIVYRHGARNRLRVHVDRGFAAYLWEWFGQLPNGVAR